MIFCPGCKTDRPEGDFNVLSRGRLQMRCKVCQVGIKFRRENPSLAGKEKYRREKPRIAAQHKKYYEGHKDKMKAVARIWAKKNPKRIKDIMRRHYWGVEPEEYARMLAAQDTKCAICRGPMKVENIDHCHDTGKIRGILCRDCNLGLGNFKDNPALLRRATEYIEYNKTQTTKQKDKTNE